MQIKVGTDYKLNSRQRAALLTSYRWSVSPTGETYGPQINANTARKLVRLGLVDRVNWRITPAGIVVLGLLSD